VRRVAIAFALAGFLSLAGAARADYGLRLATTSVRVGGLLRGTGYAPGLPVYLVPESRAPRPRKCHGGTAYCPRRSVRPPGKPYVLLGRFPRRRRNGPFAFRVPRVALGRYQVVLWCKPCGGTLLLAGATLYGQVVTVRR
jgi:hypothetical protein